MNCALDDITHLDFQEVEIYRFRFIIVNHFKPSKQNEKKYVIRKPSAMKRDVRGINQAVTRRILTEEIANTDLVLDLIIYVISKGTTRDKE